MTIETKRIISNKLYILLSMETYLLFFIFRWRPILGTQLQYLMLTMMGRLPNIFSPNEH